MVELKLTPMGIYTVRDSGEYVGTLVDWRDGPLTRWTLTLTGNAPAWLKRLHGRVYAGPEEASANIGEAERGATSDG